jgi:CMP-N,N'-diacetyllegionaminic acid synthase
VTSIAFIPARSGSKGIPNKNIKPLYGKPLIIYTLIAALQSEADTVVVSSDSDETFLICQEYTAEKYPSSMNRLIYHKRPASLATDTSQISGAIKNFFIEWPWNSESKLCILQPTSPIRCTLHINEMMNMLGDRYASVISVTEPSQKPQEMLVNVNGKYEWLMGHQGGKQRQQYEKVAYINGSIYCFMLNHYLANEPVVGKGTRFYYMDDVHSIDIDTPMDFLIAECVLKRQIHAQKI